MFSGAANLPCNDASVDQQAIFSAGIPPVLRAAVINHRYKPWLFENQKEFPDR